MKIIRKSELTGNRLRQFISDHFWSIGIILILISNILIFSKDKTVRKYYLYRDYAYFHSEKEEIAFPVQAINEAIVDTYGHPRPGGRIHEGIDIFCDWGTPIVAVVDGTTIYKGRDKLGGRVIYLLGRDNQVYYYAHLSRFASIQTGDLVKQNQIIARAGNSGNARSTPTHLHFEIMTISWLLPLVMKNINPYQSLIETGNYKCLLDSLNLDKESGETDNPN